MSAAQSQSDLVIASVSANRQHMKFKRDLAKKIQKKKRELWDWHREHARVAPPPFYCSVDLRDSGHKIVPVDSNLFPAGFNNICPEDLRAAPAVIRAQIDALSSRTGRTVPKKILIIPESHTSNTYYIENLYYLKQVITNAGYEVAVGWYVENATEPVSLVSVTEKTITAYPIQINDGLLSVQTSEQKFVPDFIILNNDFSAGYPKPLDLVQQPIYPSHTLGWHSRKKSEHFRHYNQLAGEFASIAGIDPWTIQIDTYEVDQVNFNDEVGIERVAIQVDEVLKRTKEAYDRLKISTPPFAFVKNNAGTYGMGIMVVHSADELRTMNRRTKNKMSVGKNKKSIDSVVVQEGVPTATLIDRLAAEPVIYLVGCDLIGGFLRTNTEKGIEDNLNSQGMVFRKLCMSDLKSPYEDDSADDLDHPEDEPILELVYGSIARISALATGLELVSN